MILPNHKTKIVCTIGPASESPDERANHEVAGDIKEIQAVDGRVKILVMPTDQEREIARQTLETIKSMKGKDR